MNNRQRGGALVWVIIAVLVILGIAYWAGQRTTTPGGPPASGAEIPSGPIVLGAMTPLSGEAIVYGEPLQRATNMAVEEINAAGGVDGHPIQLIWEDSKCTPQDGTTAAQKLVEVDKVKFIIGTGCSGETLAAAEITEPAGVLLFSAAASSPDVTNAGDFVFRTYPSDGVGGQVLATYLYNELGKRRLAIVSELTDFAQGLRKTMHSTFESLGGAVVASETYATGDTDFRTQLLKIKATSADAVYIVPQTPVSGNLVLKQLRENNVVGQVLVADPMLGKDDIAANAALYTSVYSATPELDPSRPVTQRYLTNYKTKYGKDPEFPAYQASSYDQVYMLKEAFETVGTDPAAVRDWLYKVKDWPGAIGDITIDANGDPIIGYHIKLIESGELKDLGAYSL